MRSTEEIKERTDTEARRDRILSVLGKNKMTANEIIEEMFQQDVASGEISNRSWKYYVHTNKLFSPMSKKILLIAGTKVGGTGREEKVWRLRG